MSGDDRYSVHKLRGWRFHGAHGVVEAMLDKCARMDSAGSTSASQFDGSTTFWTGYGGEAARNLSTMHYNDFKRSIKVLVDVATKATQAIDALQSEISVLDGKMAEAEQSEFEFSIKDSGQVYSRRSIDEWKDEWGWKAPFKLPMMLSDQSFFSEAITGARAAIYRVDQQYSDAMRTAMENLSDAVKTGVAPQPKDPALQHILETYQTRTSSRGSTLWPSPEIIAKAQSVGIALPGGDAKLVTQEEAEILNRLFLKTVKNKATFTDGDPGGLIEFNNIRERAQQAAEQRYPGTTADGKGDAYRHAYWNALMTQEYGAEWTKTYTTAHEGLGGQPANREAMDLYNNEIGRRVAMEHPDATPEELGDLVATEVTRGSTVSIGHDNTIQWTNRLPDREVGSPGTVGIPLPSH